MVLTCSGTLYSVAESLYDSIMIHVYNNANYCHNCLTITDYLRKKFSTFSPSNNRLKYETCYSRKSKFLLIGYQRISNNSYSINCGNSTTEAKTAFKIHFKIWTPSQDNIFKKFQL